MPWKCPICGYENPDDAEYCLKCGTAKSAALTQAMPQATQPEQVSQPEQPQQIMAPSETQPMTTPETQVQQTQVVSAQQSQEGTVQQTPEAQPAVSAQPQEAQVVQAPQVSGKIYLQFIQTPVSQLNNMKLPLDFETFPSISIGRSPENVIVIPDPEVSRRHAILTLENNDLYLEDLNSTNGTYVYDGKMFQPVKGKTKLTLPAVVKLGNQTIVKLSRG